MFTEDIFAYYGGRRRFGERAEEEWARAIARESGIHFLAGGHYATETFGVKALAAHLSARFKVPWTFLDHPTGL